MSNRYYEPGSWGDLIGILIGFILITTFYFATGCSVSVPTAIAPKHVELEAVWPLTCHFQVWCEESIVPEMMECFGKRICNNQ